MKKRAILLFSFFLLATAHLMAQEAKGRIIDKSSNSPLQGVTVSVQGSQVNTQTDAGGNFTLPLSAPYPIALTLTYVGARPQAVTVSGPAALNIE